VTAVAEIAPLDPSRTHAAAAVLAESFLADPVHSHVFPDAGARRMALRRLFEGLVIPDALRHGVVHAASAGEELLGVAVWLPPGAYPLATGRKLRGVPALLSALAAAPRALPAFARLGSGIEQAFPATPHWYLEVLGVAPARHGQGVGTGLLAPLLERADRERLPCYLETGTRPNVAFYERLGFRVERELALLPGGPPQGTMARPARAAD
jgi:GNAT superfamily N-acetyltransferase